MASTQGYYIGNDPQMLPSARALTLGRDSPKFCFEVRKICLVCMSNLCECIIKYLHIIVYADN